MFLKNRNIISKIKRSKVKDYAALNGLGGDTFTRNVTDACMHRRTDRQKIDHLRYEINMPFFSLKKGSIITQYAKS